MAASPDQESYRGNTTGTVNINGQNLGSAVGGNYGTMNTTYNIATPIPVPVLHQLRPVVPDFTARMTEIEQVLHQVESNAGSGTGAIVGVRGMGGVGKTELAYVISHHLTSAFPDAQLVVELRGTAEHPASAEQALQTIIHALSPQTEAPDTLEQLQALYYTLLHNKRVLILADDASDVTQVEALVPPAGCALIITSRQHFQLPGMQVIDLPVLSSQEAIGLLHAICQRVGDCAAQFVDLCGYLPLAIRIGATFLTNDATLEVDDYLRILADERLRLSGLQNPDHPDLPRYSVAATINLSYRALNPTHQTIARHLGVFPTSFDREAARAVVVPPEVNIVPIDRVLSHLVQRSLVHYDSVTRRYRLHDLVRLFMVEQLRQHDEDQLVHRRHVHHYGTLAAQAEDSYRAGGDGTLTGLQMFDNARPHIDAAWAWVRQQPASDEMDDLLIAFTNSTGNIGDLRYNRLRERLPQSEAALQAARRRGNRMAEAGAHGYLGNVYVRLGDPRNAIHHYDAQLVILQELGDRANEGYALSNISGAYLILSDFQRAREYAERSLDILRELGDRQGESAALNALGNTYLAAKQPEQAVELFRELVNLDEALGDRRGVAISIGNLGKAYTMIGQMQQAIDCYQRQLSIADTLGDRDNESNALSSLGITHQRMGATDQAINYYERHITLTSDLGDRDGEAHSSWNLGRLLVGQGDRERGFVLMQLCVDYQRAIGHPDAERDAAELAQLRRSSTCGHGA